MSPRSRTVPALLLLLLAASAALGCQERGREPAPEPGPSDGTIPLRVDDAEAARVSLAPGAEPRPLASYLEGAAASADAWTHVQAHGRGGRRFGVRHPARRYPDTELRVFRDDDGALSLGIFRRSRPDLSAEAAAELAVPILALSDIQDIEIFLREPTPSAPPDALAPIAIQIGDAEPVALTAEELAAIPRATDPRGRSQGWALRDLVRAKIGEQHLASIELVLEDGTPHAIDPAALDDPRRLLLLKHNREGELRYQEYAVGGEVGSERLRADRVVRAPRLIRVRTLGTL